VTLTDVDDNGDDEPVDELLLLMTVCNGVIGVLTVALIASTWVVAVADVLSKMVPPYTVS
jgi:hypothetical protein